MEIEQASAMVGERLESRRVLKTYLGLPLVILLYGWGPLLLIGHEPYAMPLVTSLRFFVYVREWFTKTPRHHVDPRNGLYSPRDGGGTNRSTAIREGVNEPGWGAPRLGGGADTGTAWSCWRRWGMMLCFQMVSLQASTGQGMGMFRTVGLGLLRRRPKEVAAATSASVSSFKRFSSAALLVPSSVL